MVQLLADVLAQLPVRSQRALYTRQFNPHLNAIAVVLSKLDPPLWVVQEQHVAELLIRRGGVPASRVFTVSAVSRYAACFGTRVRSFKSAALAMDWANDGMPQQLEGGV